MYAKVPISSKQKTPVTAEQRPHVFWSWGTGYDLFASLHVLHHPEKFGLRGSWAAGVRSRLSPVQRTILEDAQELLFNSPLLWVFSLPDPKDATTVLRALEQLPTTERLPELALQVGSEPDVADLLREVSSRHAWNNTDLERLQSSQGQKGRTTNLNRQIITLDWWSRSDEFGERYLAALQAYVASFFAEEERRIEPYLKLALEKGQALAKQFEFSKLMVELSQGVKIAALEGAEEVVFVPSYWITPLLMYEQVKEMRWVVLYGARPAEVPLVPGEMVPDAMLLALKALSDPTRLLILRYLSDQPQTPSELSRRLRLRAPTVIHHLSALRLAGLVYVSMDEHEEKRYTVRKLAVEGAFGALQKFLLVDGDHKA
jgi:DNA-binding transcriptional ArsR family regulator